MTQTPQGMQHRYMLSPAKSPSNIARGQLQQADEMQRAARFLVPQWTDSSAELRRTRSASADSFTSRRLSKRGCVTPELLHDVAAAARLQANTATPPPP